MQDGEDQEMSEPVEAIEEEEQEEEEDNDEEITRGLVDIGDEAVWSVSSYKLGLGVEGVRDGQDADRFWQSDGPLPHYIDVLFSKRVNIEMILVYMDYNLDESYTPKKITLSAGTGYHDLEIVDEMILDQPQGWIPLQIDPLKTFLVRLTILANHQSGKDTHLRGLKILSPARQSLHEDFVPFTSIAMMSESVIR